MVNSSLHVPSACVGFTYTKGSWWMVTICKVKHKHLLVSIPLQSYVPLGGELGCPLHKSMANMLWCSPQLLSWLMGLLSPAAGPGFDTGNICFPCTQDEEQPLSTSSFMWHFHLGLKGFHTPLPNSRLMRATTQPGLVP